MEQRPSILQDNYVQKSPDAKETSAMLPSTVCMDDGDNQLNKKSSTGDPQPPSTACLNVDEDNLMETSSLGNPLALHPVSSPPYSSLERRMSDCSDSKSESGDSDVEMYSLVMSDSDSCTWKRRRKKKYTSSSMLDVNAKRIKRVKRKQRMKKECVKLKRRLENRIDLSRHQKLKVSKSLSHLKRKLRGKKVNRITDKGNKQFAPSRK